LRVLASQHAADSTVPHTLLLLLCQVDVSRFMSDGQRLAELIQAVKLQHKQQLLQQLLQEDEED
jgi:hypothetical protein